MSSLLALVLELIGFSNCVQLNVSRAAGNTSSYIQYGLIFEDISNSGDGGIYAELIQNRAFQPVSLHNATVDPWISVNSILSLIDTYALSEALHYSINVARPSVHAGKVGFSNTGWWGIDVRPQTYKGSFHVRGTYEGIIEASLKSDTTSKTFAKTTLRVKSTRKEWSEYKFALTPETSASDVNNSLIITYQPAHATDGSLSFNLLSLFPPTYNDRPNDFPVATIWRATAWTEILPVESGTKRLGRWLVDQEDLVLLQYRRAGSQRVPGMDGHYLNGVSLNKKELRPYVQDALDELEYLMGSTDTTFDASRASHGYPNPWKIKFVEIGNEDNLSEGLTTYQNYRFEHLYDAIASTYSGITIIASTIDINIPRGAGGDYHIYSTPDDLVSKFSIFDNQSTDTYILAGEYSTRVPNGGVDPFLFPTWIGAVAESVSNIGLERNTGKVLGSTYAPILQNLNRYQWTPDLVSFTADPDETVRSMSVAAIALLASTLFPETREVTTVAELGPAYWVAGQNGKTGGNVLKVAVYDSTDSLGIPFSVKFDGVKKGAHANLTVLTAPGPYSSATPGRDPIKTTQKALTAGKRGRFRFELPDLSVAVLETE